MNLRTFILYIQNQMYIFLGSFWEDDSPILVKLDCLLKGCQKNYKHLRKIVMNLKVESKQLPLKHLQTTTIVGGWTNPSEKDARQFGSFPQVGLKNVENKKYLKPPSRFPKHPPFCWFCTLGVSIFILHHRNDYVLTQQNTPLQHLLRAIWPRRECLQQQLLDVQRSSNLCNLGS